MGILQGKNILVTGVLTDGSIAFHIAKIAQEEGANVLLTGFGRALSLTTRIAGRLPQTPPIIELDVTDQSHLDGLAEQIRGHLPHLDRCVASLYFHDVDLGLHRASARRSLISPFFQPSIILLRSFSWNTYLV